MDRSGPLSSFELSEFGIESRNKKCYRTSVVRDNVAYRAPSWILITVCPR
jgi:hypothetical protein